MMTFAASLIGFVFIVVLLVLATFVSGRPLPASCGGVGSGRCACCAAPGDACRHSDENAGKFTTGMRILRSRDDKPSQEKT